MKYVLGIMLLLACQVYAEVYKWTDADGNVHYGDRPKAGNARELDIESQPSTPDGPDNANKNQQDIERWLKARDEERSIREQEEAALQQQKARQKQKCSRLRNELRDYEKGGVVWYEIDESGNRRYYSDADIAKEIADLKKTIKRECPR